MSTPAAESALPPRLAAAGDIIPCVEELTHVNESLHRQEGLLAASARASRLLLEAPDVNGAIPKVLRLIGEAAHVDRVNVMLAKIGPEGEPLLVLAGEWTAEGVPPLHDDPEAHSLDEREIAAVTAELRAGRSVCLNAGGGISGCASITRFEGVGTRSKAVVPIVVAGEFIGVLE